eukprot:2530852-Lingulodinium_polyedra.AAC.1
MGMVSVVRQVDRAWRQVGRANRLVAARMLGSGTPSTSEATGDRSCRPCGSAAIGTNSRVGTGLDREGAKQPAPDR